MQKQAEIDVNREIYRYIYRYMAVDREIDRDIRDSIGVGKSGLRRGKQNFVPLSLVVI
jgi:hypothetical protein